jgi:hypothetical protein
MTFPKPPNQPIRNRDMPPPSSPIGPVAPPPLVTPVPVENEQGKLTETEVDYILRTSLRPDHLEDPNILRFISSYMRCRNAAQAARESGLSTPHRSGANIRAMPDVHQAITRLTEKSVMKYGFDASEVIERVKEISALDPVEFENEDGSYKNKLSDIAPESRRAIKKLKVRNLFGTDANGMKTIVGEIIEIEMWDKMKGLELLGREKQIFKETTRVEHDITSNMASVLLDSKRRAEEKYSEVIDVTPQLNPGGSDVIKE